MGVKNTHEDILKIIGSNIRKEREEKGISQEKLAELIDMHRTYIGLVERGQRNPTIRTIYKICKVLKIESKYILNF